MELLVIGLVGLVVYLLYRYGTSSHGYWKERGVPFEPPLPFVGNLLDTLLLRRNQGQIVGEIYHKFENAPLVGMFNMTAPALMVRDPTLVNQILVGEFSNFHHNELLVDEEVDPVFAKNLFCCRGAVWKRRRQVLSPSFTVGKIKLSFPKILRCADKLAEFIEKNPGEVKAKDVMARFTSEIVASWGLGIDGHSFTGEDPILLKCGKIIFEPSTKTAINGIAIFLFPFVTKLFKMPFIPAEVPQFFESVIRDMINHRKKTGESEPDYLQHFIDIQKKLHDGNDELEVTDDDILAGMISFFVEGYETSSMVSSFFLYHLAMNPDIQEKLRSEVSAKELTFDNVNEMVLLEQCFKETNRLHPALGNLSKSCTSDTVVGGVNVEAGTTMIIPLIGLHMDAKYWNQPLKFDPTRFDEPAPKGVYLPFGDGPRICIGYRLAGIVVKTAIARVIRDFAVVPSPNTPKKFEQNPLHFMPSQKGGLFLQFKKLAN